MTTPFRSPAGSATVFSNDQKIRVGTLNALRSSRTVFLGRNVFGGGVRSLPPSSSSSSSIQAVSTPAKPEAAKPTKRSKVEIIKEKSNFIRYPLNEELLTEAPNVNESAVQLIKFHGSYQQYNREERGGRSYSFMLRTKNPSGKVPNQLYLTMDDLADEFGIGTLRLTTRQTFQLHGVVKHNLKTVMSSIIRNMGSTLGACGDLNRNVLAPAAPYAKRDYLFAQETADNIAALLSPQSGFYYDMWVDGEQFMTAEPPEVVEARNDNSHGTNFVDSPEPIYGTQFLPRKFKIAVTVPTDNSVDLLTNDIGVVVVSDENGEPQGFNIYVGGGMGRTHRMESTFARIAARTHPKRRMASSVISSSPFLCKSSQAKDLGFPKPSQISVHRCQKRSISRKIVSVMAPQRSSSSTGSVKTGMTMTEKILAKAAEKSQVVPGDNIWVNVDVLMTHDVCGPGAFGIFKREFGEKAKVWDPEKIVVIPDHYIFTTDQRANRNVDIMREHCREQNIKYFYDITDLGDFRANPDYKGVCHVALAQEGHCRPGEVLLGTDSHTCTAGAFGQFATGIGNTDAGFVLGTGKILLKVPPTMRFILDGEMPSYLQAKDLILQIIGEISVAGATYKTMEFSGTTIESLTMEERMTLCNMVVEAGGKNGVIPPDATTFNYVENRTSVPFEAVYSDGNASFAADYRFDVSKLEPVVAKPHSPDNRALARECKDVKIDRVYIGSCTGGKTEDFMAAAKLLHAAGKQVKVPTFLVPATQKVWMDVYALPVPGADGKTCAQIFEEAGCDTPTSPSCGACLGGPADTYARLNEPQVCVSTTNRNFPGRMGHKEGQIYLASPYTAAASALTGHVTDPREFLQ